MVQTLIPADRQTRIQRLIEEKGIVKVTELSKMFDVTELTIRRDFDVLEKKRILERNREGGGVILTLSQSTGLTNSLSSLSSVLCHFTRNHQYSGMIRSRSRRNGYWKVITHLPL